MSTIEKFLAECEAREKAATPRIDAEILALATTPESQEHEANLVKADKRLQRFISDTETDIPALIRLVRLLVAEVNKQKETAERIVGYLTEECRGDEDCDHCVALQDLEERGLARVEKEFADGK